MTVLVMYADKDYIYISSDGRASGAAYIYSDKSVKVVGGTDYIFGQCGGCDDEIPFRKLIEEAKTDPWEMIKLSHNDTYKTMFYHFGCIVATKKHGLYHVERVPAKDPKIESDPVQRPKVKVMPVTIEDLPIFDGSGYAHLQGRLAKVKKLTPTIVEKAIKDIYSVNHTIGGKVRTIKLKRK